MNLGTWGSPGVGGRKLGVTPGGGEVSRGDSQECLKKLTENSQT